MGIGPNLHWTIVKELLHLLVQKASRRNTPVESYSLGTKVWPILNWHLMLIEINKTGPFLLYLCLLSTINVRVEASKDRLLLVWKQYNCVSCCWPTVVLTSPVTFDPWAGLDLSHLLYPWSCDFMYQALLLFSVQHWIAGNDEASIMQWSLCNQYLTSLYKL